MFSSTSRAWQFLSVFYIFFSLYSFDVSPWITSLTSSSPCLHSLKRRYGLESRKTWMTLKASMMNSNELACIHKWHWKVSINGNVKEGNICLYFWLYERTNGKLPSNWTGNVAIRHDIEQGSERRLVLPAKMARLEVNLWCVRNKCHSTEKKEPQLHLWWNSM